MDADRLRAWGPAGVVALTFAAGAAGAGAGPKNGDAAVYAWQAANGLLDERTVHFGYVLLAAGLHRVVGDALPLALDLLSAACAAGLVGLAGRVGRVLGAEPTLPALAAAGLVGVHAPFAEVDLVWLALVGLAGFVPSPIGAGLAFAAAFLVSPVAMLALPLTAWVRVMLAEARSGAPRTRRLLDDLVIQGLPLFFGFVLAIGLMHNLYPSDYWRGERGLLRPKTWTLAQSAAAAASGLFGAWVLAVLPGLKRAGWGLLLGLPLLLAPPDVPAWLAWSGPIAVGIGLGLAAAPRRWVIGLITALALDLGFEATQLRADVVAVRADNTRIQTIVREWDPERALIAPWSWGVRASILGGGAPYALPWIDPVRPVRGQAAAVCGRPWRVVTVLPAGGDGQARLAERCAVWAERDRP